MKTKFRGMTLAAMLLSASTVASGEQNDVAYDGDGFVTPVAYVGDVSSAEEDAYFAEDATQAIQANEAMKSAARATMRPASHTVKQIPQPEEASQPAATRYAPVSASQLQPVGYDMGGGTEYSSPVAAYCDAGCDSGCDSQCGGGAKYGNFGDLFMCNSGSGWARGEILLWKVQDRDLPSLITTAPAGEFPDLLNPNAQTVFGGETDSDMSIGFRGDYGKYLTDDIGVGARFWIIDESSDDYARASDGSDISIGRPFFNTAIGQEFALLVAFAGVGANDFAGSVDAESSIDLLGAEAYGRFNFVSASCCQMDLIGGYSHFSIDDTLRITSTSINTNPATGQTRVFNDLFETENRFHGGQIGVETVTTRGRWSARTLAKVHLGNMEQTARLTGSRTDTLNGDSAAGMLIQLGESGEAQRDEFSFAPELNLKLAYRFRDHVDFSVGYSFIYWDSVALAGDLVNRNIDEAQFQIPFAENRVSFPTDSGLWVQGIDFGVGINY